LETGITAQRWTEESNWDGVYLTWIVERQKKKKKKKKDDDDDDDAPK
jgi:hypothetical protein